MSRTAPRGPYKPGRIRQESEQRILNAATSTFSQHGYAGTSMQSIADMAGVPKANVHYYFKNKLGVYTAVLENILGLWDTVLNDLTVEDDPADALCRYIDAKITFSRTHPQESRVFAKEMLSGAPHLQEFLAADYRAWLEARLTIFRGWISAGKMDPIDPAHLLFMIWGSTQHYADFEPQVMQSLGTDSLQQAHFDAAAKTVKQVILKGCGLTPT
ncbi:MAG TPA: TetR family transcriptional regulator [Oceanospirillaceae bacterium]|nr:TetR family transcriptional regulator [Oceanospirillaceae bacterium]